MEFDVMNIVRKKYNTLIHSLWVCGGCVEIVVSKAGKGLSVMKDVHR